MPTAVISTTMASTDSPRRAHGLRRTKPTTASAGVPATNDMVS